MLADDIKATESRIRQLETRYLRELSEVVHYEEATPSTAKPEAFRPAARIVAYMTSFEIERERHKLLDQLYARVRELEKQINCRKTKPAED